MDSLENNLMIKLVGEHYNIENNNCSEVCPVFVISEFGNDNGNLSVLYVMTYLNHYHSFDHEKDDGCYYCML